MILDIMTRPMIAIPDGMDMVMERTNTHFTPPGRIHPCLPKYTSPAMDDRNRNMLAWVKGRKGEKSSDAWFTNPYPVDVSGKENPMDTWFRKRFTGGTTSTTMVTAVSRI